MKKNERGFNMSVRKLLPGVLVRRCATAKMTTKIRMDQKGPIFVRSWIYAIALCPFQTEEFTNRGITITYIPFCHCGGCCR